MKALSDVKAPPLCPACLRGLGAEYLGKVHEPVTQFFLQGYGVATVYWCEQDLGVSLLFFHPSQRPSILRWRSMCA